MRVFTLSHLLAGGWLPVVMSQICCHLCAGSIKQAPESQHSFLKVRAGLKKVMRGVLHMGSTECIHSCWARATSRVQSESDKHGKWNDLETPKVWPSNWGWQKAGHPLSHTMTVGIQAGWWWLTTISAFWSAFFEPHQTLAQHEHFVHCCHSGWTNSQCLQAPHSDSLL